MAATYRVRYRAGDLEIEVESTESEYVDQKFNELLSLSPPAVAKKHRASAKKSRAGRTPPAADASSASVVDIVTAINDFESYSDLEKYILNKKAQLPRILMCLYFVRNLDTPYLQSGDVEAITDQLGIKILARNVASSIKDNQKYFTADGVRKRGARVGYKLNRQGIKAFENLLDGEQL